MALTSKTGEITCPGATGAQAISGLGFQPKLVIFFGGNVTATGNAAGSHMWMGATDGTNQWAFGINDQDAVSASSKTVRFGYNNACIKVYTVNSTTAQAIAAITSLDSDGFTINWSVVSSGKLVSYIAFGGSDLTNVKVGTFTEPIVTGNSGVTGVGFKPDFTMFASNVISTINTAAINNSTFGFGAAHSTTERFAVTVAGQNNTSSHHTQHGQFTDHCCLLSGATSAATSESADLVTMDSDGFTLNWDVVSGTAWQWGYIAMKGGQYKIGNNTAPTSTGNQSTTGVGFTPTSEIFASYNDVAQSTVQTQGRLTLGAAVSSSDRRTHWYGSSNTVNPSVSKEAYATTLAITQRTEGATPTTNAEADFVSQDSDGFTLNWTTADVTARQFVYAAFGSTATPATGNSNFFNFF